MQHYGGGHYLQQNLNTRAKQNRALRALERSIVILRRQVIVAMQQGNWRAVAIGQRQIHAKQVVQIQLARKYRRSRLLRILIRRINTSPYRPFGPPQTPYAPYYLTYPQRQYRPAPNPGAQQNYLKAAGLAGLGSLEISTGMGGIL